MDQLLPALAGWQRLSGPDMQMSSADIQQAFTERLQGNHSLITLEPLDIFDGQTSAPERRNRRQRDRCNTSLVLGAAQALLQMMGASSEMATRLLPARRLRRLKAVTRHTRRSSLRPLGCALHQEVLNSNGVRIQPLISRGYCRYFLCPAPNTSTRSAWRHIANALARAPCAPTCPSPTKSSSFPRA